MYKPSTYLEVVYFPTYLPIYETYFLQNWLPRWNQILTQLRFIHNWVITDIQWMVRWWVAGSLWLMQWTKKSQFLPNFVSPTQVFQTMTPTHTHWHTHTQRLCCWHHYYWVFYKTLQTTTPPNNTHTCMEYTNAHKWSKVTMPITEHRTMTNQVKSFDLGWSMHHIFTPYDETCSVKKLCFVFCFITHTWAYCFVFVHGINLEHLDVIYITFKI